MTCFFEEKEYYIKKIKKHFSNNTFGFLIKYDFKKKLLFNIHT